jgi:hypothetical protein
MAYANILDTILNTPNHDSYTRSAALGDAFMDIDTRSTARPMERAASTRLKDDVAEAVTKVAATSAPTVVKFASVEQAVKFGGVIAKYAAKYPDLKPAAEAAARLARVASKTPEQMALDGATKLADYINPAIVPAWARQVRSDIAILHSVRNQFHQAAQKKAKQASLQVFDKSVAADHTKSLMNAAGDADYLEPSAMMGEDDAHVPGTRFAGQKHTANDKTPRLVTNPVAPKNINPTRTTKAAALRLRPTETKEVRFTAATITKLTSAGHSLDKIFKAASKVAGAVKTKVAFEEFFKGLKKTNTKIALTQIDCSLLKGKLATNNTIVGEKKCATCSYRKGMHCGFTGGTLITVPGIESVRPQHRVASGAPKDGYGIMREFDMVTPKVANDIEFNKTAEMSDSDFFSGSQGMEI